MNWDAFARDMISSYIENADIEHTRGSYFRFDEDGKVYGFCAIGCVYFYSIENDFTENDLDQTKIVEKIAEKYCGKVEEIEPHLIQIAHMNDEQKMSIAQIAKVVKGWQK